MNRAFYDALVALEPDRARRLGRLFKRRDGAARITVRQSFETAVRRAAIPRTSGSTTCGTRRRRTSSCAAPSSPTLRYSHPSPAHVRAAVDRLDGLTSALAPANEAPAETLERPTTIR